MASLVPLLLSPLFLLAQQGLTPEDAVRLALEQNAYLAGSASRITVAEGLRTQAGLKPNPRLFLQSENARIPVPAPMKFWTDTDSFSYVSQVFETNGKRQRRVDVASENVRGAELTLALQKAQVASRVLGAYWSAVGAERLASVLGESLKVLDQTVEFQRLRVKEGALPEADLTRVLLEYQQVAITYQNAQQDARRLLLLLYREMGLPQESRATLRGDLAAVAAIALPDVDAAVENRADVRLSAQAVQQAQATVRLQRANARPDPEVLFGYKRTLGFNTVVAGVQINLPVRNKNQGAIAAAAADSTAAAADLRATRMAAKTEIEALLGEYQQKRDLVQQMLPTLREQANLTRRIADAVYREGASDLLRLLDAERVRIQTETLYVQSLIQYRLSAINLQTALGQLP
ncbi:MAG: TolC family protein [Bryobacterales bacterium]|nr:TolC family protein [Bryobacterales bacterium]